ncbi:phage tail tape measure protein [Rhodococcus maanshanensis]|uniref:phage tail tape measure protein n=1 Tax=Rhodococcus maanshanensis TaxID=183556 RepID=UPI0022B3609A|nr:phage tail tape measure protein [Rhodococcus maanshanensis]MCZ4557989.1 phage tail tape measure protein [Rhodococcus maanshanensis]
MALQVGELYSKLTLDNAEFLQDLRESRTGFGTLSQAAERAAQDVRTAGTNAATGFETVGRHARAVGDGAQDSARQVRRIGDSAGQVSNDLRGMASSAEQAGRATRGIDVPSGLAARVNQLSQSISNMGGRAAIMGSTGSSMGDSFVSGFSNKVQGLGSKAGPIGMAVAGVLGIGLAAGAVLAGALRDGMQQQADQGLVAAQLGVDQATAERIGRAAGEAYGNNFGESVKGNMDAAKLAMQTSLIDRDASQAEIQGIVEDLGTVSKVLGDDIPLVARAAGQAVKTGLVDDASGAMDLFVAAGQAGLNISGDFLESVNEYGTQFRSIGLSGAEAFGLMSQAVKAGARDSDVAADALKEFTIRSKDGSKASAEAYEALGLSAEEMNGKMAMGGEAARDGLDMVLTKLRETEDPMVRNAAAVGLFGTQAEDLADALGAMDLNTAEAALGGVAGAVEAANAAMSNNGAAAMESAMRSIEVAGNDVKLSLAQAFGPALQQLAEWVANNKGTITEFFVGLVDGAIGAGIGIAKFALGALESMEGLVDGLSPIMATMSNLVGGFSEELGGILKHVPGMETTGKALEAGGKGMQWYADQVEKLPGRLDGMTSSLEGVVNGLEGARTKFGEFGATAIDSAKFGDEIAKNTAALDKFGQAAEQNKIKTGEWRGKLDESVPSQAAMAEQLRALEQGFKDQAIAGVAAGETVDALQGSYLAQRGALVSTLTQMGLNEEQAKALVASYNLTPTLIQTAVTQPGMERAQTDLQYLNGLTKVDNNKNVYVTDDSPKTMEALRRLNLTVLDGKVVPIDANDVAAQAKILELQKPGYKSITVGIDIEGTAAAQRAFNASGQEGPVAPIMRPDAPGFTPADRGGESRSGNFADGGITARFADGGSLPSQATIQSPRPDLVQWAEPETEGEAFIPMAGSKRARSLAILAEVAKRFGLGLTRYADGGVRGGGFDGDAAADFFKSHDGEPYQYGKLDCSGLLSAGFNKATGQSVRFTTDSDFAALGWVRGYDPDGFSIGTNGGVGENGHMAGTLRGTDVESDGSNGIRWGRGAQGAQDFPEVWHWPGASAGGPSAKAESPEAAKLRSEIEKAKADETAAGSYGDRANAQLKVAELQTQLDKLEGNGGRTSKAAVQRAEMLRAMQKAQTDEAEATTPEKRLKAEQKLDGLEDKLKAFDAKSAADALAEPKSSKLKSSATDGSGQPVFVTNWPGSFSPTTASSTTSTPPANSPPSAAGEPPSHDISTGAGRASLAQAIGAKFFANGGFGGVGRGEDHTAQIASAGSWRVFGEPETGGEAYIPLSPAKRSRSLSIWRQTGQKLGAFATGAAMTVASGFDDDGQFKGFDTSSSSMPGLAKALEQLAERIQPKPAVVIEHAEIVANDPQQLAQGVADTAGVQFPLLQNAI